MVAEWATATDFTRKLIKSNKQQTIFTTITADRSVLSMSMLDSRPVVGSTRDEYSVGWQQIVVLSSRRRAAKRSQVQGREAGPHP
jgi:hypothetical protein